MPVTQAARPERTDAAPAARPVLELGGHLQELSRGSRRSTRWALRLYPGVVTALVGENGAGKSTLVKILTGIYQPDAGRIALDGAETSFPTAHAAASAGVTAIHQETVLFDELTVAENILLGHAPRGRFGLIDWEASYATARAMLARVGADDRPAGAAARPRHRQQAPGGGGPRAVDRRARGHHGRADGGAVA